MILFVVNEMLLLKIPSEEELSKETQPRMEGNIISLIIVYDILSYCLLWSQNKCAECLLIPLQYKHRIIWKHPDLGHDETCFTITCDSSWILLGLSGKWKDLS